MANFHHILVHFLSVCDLAVAVLACLRALQPQKTRRNSIEWSSLSSPFDYYYFSSAPLGLGHFKCIVCYIFRGFLKETRKQLELHKKMDMRYSRMVMMIVDEDYS